MDLINQNLNCLETATLEVENGIKRLIQHKLSEFEPNCWGKVYVKAKATFGNPLEDLIITRGFDVK